MTFAIRSERAGAATIVVDGYELDLAGHCLTELTEACRALLDALAAETPAENDADLRAQLPGIAPSARLHAWMFPCFMTWMPVLVFATDGDATAVYTRTLSETPGMPLVVLEARDRESPTLVATADVARHARTFLAAQARR